LPAAVGIFFDGRRVGNFYRLKAFQQLEVDFGFKVVNIQSVISLCIIGLFLA